MLKKYLNRLIVRYVSKNKDVQREIVAGWAKGVDIKKYCIEDSEVTLSNVNMIYSSITGCTLKEVNQSHFEDSPIYINVEKEVEQPSDS